MTDTQKLIEAIDDLLNYVDTKSATEAYYALKHAMLNIRAHLAQTERAGNRLISQDIGGTAIDALQRALNQIENKYWDGVKINVNYALNWCLGSMTKETPPYDLSQQLHTNCKVTAIETTKTDVTNEQPAKPDNDPQVDVEALKRRIAELEAILEARGV